MKSQSLKSYIQQKIEKGITESDIIEELKGAGWAIPDINIGLAEAKGMFSRPPMVSAPALVAEAFNIFLRRWKLFIAVALIPFLADLIPITLLHWFYPGYELHEQIQLFFSLPPLYAYPLFTIWVSISVIASIWSQLAMIKALLHKNEAAGAFASYASTNRFLLSYVWINILTSFFIIGGSILFIFPGILFTLWFLFDGFILVDQNIKGFRAILLSKKYTEGYTWQIFKKMLFLGLMIVLVMIAVGMAQELLIFILNQIFPLTIFWESLVEEIFSSSIIFLALPLFIILISLLYRSLKNIKSDTTIPKASFGKSFMIPSIIGWVIAAGLFALVMYGFFTIYKDGDLTGNLDMLVIQAPLAIYERENNTYPETLEALVPKYMDKLPEAFQNKENFSYSTENNSQSYQLCLLKDGFEDECISK